MSAEGGIGGFLSKLFGPSQPAAGVGVVGPDRVVTPDAGRCVQCGICGYNCPVGIPVREYARQGLVVDDERCVQCGQCVDRCPRGTLRWALHPRPQRQLLAELEAQLLTEGIAPPAQTPNQRGRDG
jgi:ferredoxin